MFKTIKEMWNDDYGGRFVVMAIPGVIILLVLLFYFAYLDQKQWEVYKTEHNCKVISHINGQLQTGYGITPSGKGGVIFTQEPDKTEWLCDDGITYYR